MENNSKQPAISHIQMDEKIVIDLSSGKRKPKNDEEKKLLEEIKAIKVKGGIIDLHYDI